MVKERPPSRPTPLPGPGVRWQDIVWRQAGLRAPARLLSLPAWADAVLVTVLLAYLLAGLAAAPMTLEEAVQDSLTADAGTLFTHPGELLPGGSATGTQDAVRLAYGSLTRYVTAAGWYAEGGRAAAGPLDLSRPGPGAVRVPDEKLKLAARSGPALFGAIGLLVVYALTRRLFGRGAAWVATLTYGLHPTLVLLGRQPVDADLTLTLGLATVLVGAGLSSPVSRGEEPGLGGWTGLSVLAGLTLASGPDAVPYLGGALAFVAAGLLARGRRQSREALAGQESDRSGERNWGPPGRPAPTPGRSRRASGYSTGPIALPQLAPAGSPKAQTLGAAAGWLAVSTVGAVLIWVLVSPALWGWLPERLAARHHDRPVLVAQQLLPDPGPDGGATRARALGRVLTDPFLTPLRLDPDSGSQGLFRAAAPSKPTNPTNPTKPTQPSSLPRATGLTDYTDSWHAGLPFGTSDGPLPPALDRLVGLVIGVILTVAALAGLVTVWWQSRRVGAAMYAWIAITAAWLVAWPSVQPDREAPLVALACLLAAAPVPVLTRTLLDFDRTRRTRAVRPADEDL